MHHLNTAPDCTNHLGIIRHGIINNGPYWPPFEIPPEIRDIALGLDGKRGYLEETERIGPAILSQLPGRAER
jgi:hypothetical protein